MSIAPGSPIVALVMGVSGSGKTTIGELLAGALHCPFFDADSFHSPESIAKMKSGVPLTEADRLPWLRRIAAKIDALLRDGESAVIACSALKRSYRDMLECGRPNVALVFLEGSYDLIRQRVEARRGHFMPPSLLKSQFDELQAPTPDENAITVDVAPSPPEIVRAILREIEVRRAAKGAA